MLDVTGGSAQQSLDLLGGQDDVIAHLAHAWSLPFSTLESSWGVIPSRAASSRSDRRRPLRSSRRRPPSAIRSATSRETRPVPSQVEQSRHSHRLPRLLLMWTRTRRSPRQCGHVGVPITSSLLSRVRGRAAGPGGRWSVSIDAVRLQGRAHRRRPRNRASRMIVMMLTTATAALLGPGSGSSVSAKSGAPAWSSERAQRDHGDDDAWHGRVDDRHPPRGGQDQGQRGPQQSASHGKFSLRKRDSATPRASTTSAPWRSWP